MDQALFNNLTLGWIAIGALVFPLTLWVTAPFGRHYSARFGPTIGNRKPAGSISPGRVETTTVTTRSSGQGT